MMKRRPDDLFCILFIAALACLACGASDHAGGEPAAVTSTGGSTMIPEIPTMGSSADDPAATAAPTTTSAGTTEEPDTSSSGQDTTGSPTGCGNGVVEEGEACDDGLSGNGDHRYCKSDCSLNVCGDGKLFVDWEFCDQGEGNSNLYGSLCDAQCAPGMRCGDHKLQPEFETCDLGKDNGGVKGDEQGILCDASCRALQLRGFVTAQTFTGDLGGLFGADLKCRNAAAVAGLPEPERFHAFLSTDDIDAKDRFKTVATDRPYVLVTGKKFADNFAALIEAGPLGEGIAATETGGALYKKHVATNTAPGGVHFSPDQDCQGWTSKDEGFDARIGLNAVPTDAPAWQDWKNIQAWVGFMSIDCNKNDFHLYCLEI